MALTFLLHPYLSGSYFTAYFYHHLGFCWGVHLVFRIFGSSTALDSQPTNPPALVARPSFSQALMVELKLITLGVTWKHPEDNELHPRKITAGTPKVEGGWFRCFSESPRGIFRFHVKLLKDIPSPKTNSKRPKKRMVGILSGAFAVSFRECKIVKSPPKPAEFEVVFCSSCFFLTFLFTIVYLELFENKHPEGLTVFITFLNVMFKRMPWLTWIARTKVAKVIRRVQDGPVPVISRVINPLIYRVCNPSYTFLMPFIGVITPVRTSKGPSCKPTIESCLSRKAKNYVTPASVMFQLSNIFTKIIPQKKKLHTSYDLTV